MAGPASRNSVSAALRGRIQGKDALQSPSLCDQCEKFAFLLTVYRQRHYGGDVNDHGGHHHNHHHHHHHHHPISLVNKFYAWHATSSSDFDTHNTSRNKHHSTSSHKAPTRSHSSLELIDSIDSSSSELNDTKYANQVAVVKKPNANDYHLHWIYLRYFLNHKFHLVSYPKKHMFPKFVEVDLSSQQFDLILIQTLR